MKWHKQINWPIAGVLFSAIGFHWVLNHIGTVRSGFAWIFGLLSPFLLGCAIAFVLNVPMRRIENGLFSEKCRLSRTMQRLLAFLLTLLLVLLVIGLALFVIIPQIGESLRTLVDQIPGALRSAQAWLLELSEKYPDIAASVLNFDVSAFEGNLEQLLSQAVNYMKTWAGNLVDFGVTAVGSVISGVANFLIGFVFAIYLLLQKEKLASQCRQILYALLPEKTADDVLDIVHLANRTFSSFLSGQCTESIILGALFFVVMSLLRMPYALMIGVLIAVTALIPIVGAFIGCVIGAFMILIVNPMQALIFVVLFLVLQQIEGNLIYPHVVGNSVGLPSMWVLAAVAVGGKLMGVVGMLVFIPLCSVGYALFRSFVKERLQKKGISESKLRYAGAEYVSPSCEEQENKVK